MISASRSTLFRRLLYTLQEPITIAFATAGAITALLALLVLGAWSLPPPLSVGTPSVATATHEIPQLAAATNSPAPTPTPRSVVAPSPTAVPPTPIDVAATVAVRSTRTPRPRPTPTPRPTRSAGPTLYYDATGRSALAPWAEGSWRLNEDLLVNRDAPIVAERWVAGPESLPTGDYAIVAEVRVRSLAEGVCNQSFGVIAGNDAEVVWGGGFFFPCGDRGVRVRLTDLTDWSDGYDRDQELTDRAIDLDSDWHLLRLEVRGTNLTLLVDGKEMLTAADPRASAEVTVDGQFGLWSQGVNVEVRRIAVYQL